MDDKKYIKATDWRTDKEFSRELSSSHPLEKRLDIYCPFDNTPLIKSEEESIEKMIQEEEHINALVAKQIIQK